MVDDYFSKILIFVTVFTRKSVVSRALEEESDWLVQLRRFWCPSPTLVHFLRGATRRISQLKQAVH
jgi:hypothetical protein